MEYLILTIGAIMNMNTQLLGGAPIVDAIDVRKGDWRSSLVLWTCIVVNAQFNSRIDNSISTTM